MSCFRLEAVIRGYHKALACDVFYYLLIKLFIYSLLVIPSVARIKQRSARGLSVNNELQKTWHHSVVTSCELLLRNLDGLRRTVPLQWGPGLRYKFWASRILPLSNSVRSSIVCCCMAYAAASWARTSIFRSERHVMYWVWDTQTKAAEIGAILERN